jgi:hypothetical protein
VALRPSYSPIAYQPPQEGGWLKAKSTTREPFFFYNNRFKPLLQRPVWSIPQLRLTVLTKQGSKKVHARPATSAVQQSTPATDRHTATWRDAHQTKRLEADVSLGMLIITRTDDVELE